MAIGDEFKKVIKGERPDEKMFVPMFKWFSGYEQNIEMANSIVKQFANVHKSVLISKLVLRNKLKHFIAYPPPKAEKENKKDFFLLDLCKYLGWTKNELYKNNVNTEDFKELISEKFGYDNIERKKIGLKHIPNTKSTKKVK